MDKFARYEILDEIFVSDHGSVCRVTDPERPDASLALKRFHHPIEDPAEPQWELQKFLDRARVQQSVAASGAAHWLQIYDLGLVGDWAYYTADYHPHSAQKLVEADVTLKPAALHGLIAGVVTGLSEIRALRHRAHGNLTPGNVLIAGGREIDSASVFLTDPASNAQAAKSGENGDLKSLGLLIHGLVLHREAPADVWPLPQSSEWNVLGSYGDAWRNLCSDLLNPEPLARPRLGHVGLRLAQFKPRKKNVLGRLAAAVAMIGLLGAGGIGALSVLDQNARSAYAKARHEWFGRFLDGISDPARQASWQKDKDLAGLLSHLNVDALRAIDVDTSRLIRWKYQDYADARDALAAVQRVQEALPGHWTKVDRAELLRHHMEERHWAQPAAYVGGLLDRVRPGPGADVVAGVDGLLNVSPAIEAGLKLPDADWQALNDRLQTMRAAGDPVLTALTNSLSAAAESDVHMTDAGLVGLDELKRDGDLAGQVTKVLQDSWPINIDREAFDKDVAAAIDVKHPKKQDILKWMQLASYHAYRHEEAIAASETLRKRLADTIDGIGRSHVNPDETQAFDAASHDASNAIAELARRPFTRRTLANGALARQSDQIQNLIEGLKKFYHPEGPEQWLTRLPAIATGSTRINLFWEAWRKVLQDSIPEMQADTKAFKARQAASEQLRSLLVSLDQEFPPAPPIPSDAFMAVGRKRRDKAIDALLPSIDLRDPKLDPKAISKAIDAYTQWTAELIQLNRDFPINKELLTQGDMIDQAWKKKADFFNDPDVQALVKEDMERLSRVRAIDSASRAELAKTVNNATAAELALAAWRRLGDNSITPAWPHNSDELAVEAKFRQRIAATLKILKNPLEATAPTHELAEQAPKRWRRYVEIANSEAMMQYAWRLHSDFGIDDVQVGKLSPEARYNLALARIRDAVNGGDKTEVQEGLKRLSQAAGELKGRPQAAALPALIARVSASEPFADKATGSTFDALFPGLARPITFARVEASSMRPYYLATTSVSVGDFSSVLDATAAWPEALRLPWPCNPGKPDLRRGPRSWEWTNTPTSPMITPLLWLWPEDANVFAEPLRERFNKGALLAKVGGNPSTTHPVQYISGQTALFFAGVCGCRLPTPQEWLAAYNQYEKSISPSQWNLRDATWEIQRQLVVSGNSSRWPDDGIFPTEMSLAHVGRAATSRTTSDGILYFNPVDAPRGNVFRSMVGNVAQFTCDAPQGTDIIIARRTANSVRDFLGQYPKSLFVIGGSALSAPEASYTEPFPVTQTEQAYADVGLRLAFTAPSRNLAEKVKWAIGDPPYFWPKAAEVGATQ